MTPIDGGYLYRGGDYSVAIVIRNRRNGRTLLETEILATEVMLTSTGPTVVLDVKSA